MGRELWETLAELMEALLPLAAEAGPLRVTGMTLDLPVEVGLKHGPDGPLVLAGLPRWRWSTAFDGQPGRLRVDVGQGVGWMVAKEDWGE